MKDVTIWIIAFFIAGFSFIAVLSSQLGFVESNNKKIEPSIIQNLKGQIFPNFTIISNKGESVDIYDFMSKKRNLILFIGSKCSACDELSVKLVTNFAKSTMYKGDYDIIAIISRDQNEFVHLRQLRQFKFNQKIAKINDTVKLNVPAYPALIFVDKTKHTILESHFPHIASESELWQFLNGLSTSTLTQLTDEKTASLSIVNSSKYSETLRPSNPRKKRKENKLIFNKKIKLETKDEFLIYNLIALEIGRNGHIFISHERGRKISIFNKSGGHVKSITIEEIMGPGTQNLYRCIRMNPIGKNQIGFLLKGAINELIMYNWKTSEFKNITPVNLSNKIDILPQLKNKDFPRNNALIDFAVVDGSHFFLLTHPKRVMGQRGFAKVFELQIGQIINTFIAFPDLQFPIMSEQVAVYNDQIYLTRDVLYTSCPLDNRIYRFDLHGDQLEPLIYPKGILKQLDEDAPDNYLEWSKHIQKLEKIDLIRGIFPFKNNDSTYLIVYRKRGKSIYFDLFDDKGNFKKLGDYTGKMEVFPINHKENYIYGYKWPEVDIEQFEAYGNPEIVIYSLDVDNLFETK